MSDTDPLLIRNDGSIRHLILNRPDKLNAIDYAQHLRLLEQFEVVARDDTVKVLTLSGVGRGFCAGDDLTSGPFDGIDPMANRKVELEMGAGPTLLLHSCAKLRSLPIPTVALMHGVALGSGYDYSLSCDFRISTRSIRYGDPRIDRALWAAEGWSYKLPRLLNQSLVTPIAYLGELLDGEKARECGLVHCVVEDDQDVRESSTEFIEKLVKVSGSAYQSTKESLLDSLDASFFQSQQMVRNAEC